MSALDAFEGQWQLTRQVRDARAGQRLGFAGTARFRRDAAGLELEEAGRWTEGALAGLAATRRYLWRADGTGGVAVLFADGRAFHRFALQEGAGAGAVHLCDPDRYLVRYRFALPGRWLAGWRVTGPAKDYWMVTEYRRC